MTNKEIKAKMANWHRAYIERDDDSYNDLYSALRTLRNAGLIDSKQWQVIFEYDEELFKEAM